MRDLACHTPLSYSCLCRVMEGIRNLEKEELRKEAAELCSGGAEAYVREEWWLVVMVVVVARPGSGVCLMLIC